MTSPTATLILLDGRVYTLDPNRPRAEALAIAGNRIAAVGTRDEVLALRSRDTEVLDLRGMTAVPGFQDAHVHFIWFGLGLGRVDLAEVPSLGAALDRVKAAADSLPPGAWVLGGGWNHDLWGGTLPTAADLDRVTGGRPALLHRKDGHSAWANGAALALAGIAASTPDPTGGLIHRGHDGSPTGILAERAVGLVGDRVPPPTHDDHVRAARSATREAHRLGVTSIHDMEPDSALQVFREERDAGRLGVRVTMQLAVDDVERAIEAGVRTGQGDDLLRIGALKIFSDGALGSRTAAMLAPYDGEPGNLGVMVTDEQELTRLVTLAATHDVACAIHAIGDRANRAVLDVFERTRPLWQPRGLRQRIEHVQLLTEPELPRLARLGIIASMQPIHATQDIVAADRFWGGRSRFAYAWRSVLNSGATLAFGSDCPVETMDPLLGLYAAATRQRADGTPAGGWYPEQRISVAEGVAAYTTGAAYAAGVEDTVGRLRPGMLADVVVLTEDVFEPPPERILRTKVACTIVDGRVVYHGGGLA